MYRSTSRVVFACLCFVAVATGSLDHILHHYDTLHYKDITHNVVRRSSSTGQVHVRRLSFNTLGRDFNLQLTRRNGLVSADFKASSIQSDGVKTAEPVNTDVLYTGHLKDQYDTKVRAVVEEDQLTATIHTPEDTYIVEPSWRHIKEPHNFTMIVYRSSDLKLNSTGASFCGHGNLVPKELEKIINKTRTKASREVKGHQRSKRATSPTKNTCPLLLVADFHFYEVIGQKDSAQTINYLLGLVDRVDEIYRTTVWEDGYTGFGFEIKEILVHKEPSDAESEYSYNTDIKWDVNELLTEFGLTEKNADFCLAHLFTHQDFDKGILGLAWIGNENINSVGGICTKTYRSSIGNQYLNTGLTSTINWGRTIVTQEADLVTAHEFGHNFGSEHDSDSDEECTPPSELGGKYIMYPAAVNGDAPNNNEFSQCSLYHITPVLKAKSDICFEEQKGVFCGNFKLEDDEECDAGFEGLDNNDPCCSSTCQLRSTARCSDVNSVCCSDCDYKTKDFICRVMDNSTCQKEAFCTGDDSECPNKEEDPAEDGIICIDNGRCQGGECIPFCETLGLGSCICQDVDESCYRCCETADGCVKYIDNDTNQDELLSEGSICVIGYCTKEGECESTVQDVVERLWDIIEDISFDLIAEIMSENLVGTIIIISIVIWMPCSCLVYYMDTKRQHEEEELDNWMDPESEQLIRPGSENRIKKHRRAPATGNVEKESVL